MCLVSLWNVELFAILTVASLSKNIKAGTLWEILKYFINYFNHINSQEVEAMAMYSAFAEEQEIIGCFLDHHEINESPKNT